MQEQSQQPTTMPTPTQTPAPQREPAVLGSQPQSSAVQPGILSGQASPTTIPTQTHISSRPCPTCHVPARPADYFCPNCGTNLKPAPPSVRLSDQMSLYVKSALLPPLGLIWGLAYLRQPSSKSKMVGLTAMVITVVVLVFAVVTTISLVNTVNEQVNTQLEQLVF